MMTEVAAGLRALADWFDENAEYASPEILAPVTVNLFLATKADLIAFKQASGASRLEKNAVGSMFWLRRDFGGGIGVEANVPREEACRRVVTGTREVPEQVVPAHVEEIVEWECEPLLAEASAA